MAKLTVNTDGGSRGNPGPAAAGILIQLDGQELFSGGKYLGETTNNIAEYKALILALNWILQKGSSYVFDEVEFILDSELIVKQLKGEYKVKDEKMKEMYQTVQGKLVQLKSPHSFKHDLREHNKVADKNVNAILDKHMQ
jgi:ribonuclease HI